MSNDQPPFDEATETGHLSMDEIADLGEGLLTDEQASSARAHLAGCVECSDRADALEATTAALRGLGPATMPSNVAERIDAALAAAATAPAATSPSNVTVMPDPAAIPRQRFRLPTAPAAAAAVVIILAVVAIVVGHERGNNNKTVTEQAGGSTAQAPLVGSNSAGSGNITQVSTGRTYDQNNLAALVPSLLKLPTTVASPTAPTTLNPSTLDATGSGAGTTTSGNAPTHSAGTGGTSVGSSAASGKSSTTTKHNRKHRNGKRVTAPVAAPDAPSLGTNSFTTNASVPVVLAHLYSDRAALLQCAATVSDTAGAVPLAVDFGRWSNLSATPPVKAVPAIIFVFASVANSATVDVYVVSPSCDSGSVLDLTLGVSK